MRVAAEERTAATRVAGADSLKTSGLTMKIAPSKTMENLVRQVYAQREPRIAAAFFRSAHKLPAVRLKKILATTDFSKLSLAGLSYASWLAEKLDAALAIMHVVKPAPVFSGAETVVLARSNLEMTKLARRQLSRLARRFSTRDQSIPATSVRFGQPFHEIVTLAGERKIDLIILATRGYTGLQRFFLGSTAEKIVRHAPCPVLTIPSSPKGPAGPVASRARLRRILVPIDFSQTSVQALPYTNALAARFNAEIILVHVFEPIPLPADSAYLPPQMRHEVRNLLQQDLGTLSREVFGENIRTRTIVRTGLPFQQITAAAKSLDADMIILTTHGYSGLKHVLLGSTAERVVRHADCPVLVVRELSGQERSRSKFRARRK
jgi:nucleotide-binding universal stress UspA family protein